MLTVQLYTLYMYNCEHFSGPGAPNINSLQIHTMDLGGNTVSKYIPVIGELSISTRVTGLASSGDYILTGDENGDLNLLDLFTLQVSF